MYTISATGHRPEHLGGHNSITEARLAAVASLALRQLLTLHAARGPMEVVSGMALGWDLAVAEQALALGLPLIAAIPCPDQPSLWPPRAVQRWARVRDQAEEVHVLSPSYSPEAMQQRNVWMVDRADLVLALFSGKKKGGTWNCVQYAKAAGVPIHNCWKDWKSEDLGTSGPIGGLF